MNRILNIVLLLTISLNVLALDDKDIKKSMEKRIFRNAQVEVLRVKGRKIDSSAKGWIKKVQASLDDCYKLLEKGRDIDYELAYIKECVNKIQLADDTWPISYYQSEIELLATWDAELTSPKESVDVEPVEALKINMEQLNEDINAILGVRSDSVKKESQEESIIDTDYEYSPVNMGDEEVQIAEEENIKTHEDKNVEVRNENEEEPAQNEQSERTSSSSSSSSSSSDIDETTLILLAIGGGALWITYYRFRRRCSACGRWNAMETYNKRFDYREKLAYNKEKRRWDYIYHFTYFRQCKHCGNKDAVERTKSTKPWLS